MKDIDFENLEILSPAGNPECFLTALNNGTDAIYLGLDIFNARMKAQNFTKENIREYIKLAHSYGVKVYITINTLLNDEDFDDLVSLVNFLTQAKADAFIVQDLGVTYILKKCFKNIVLHASTQMGIHNLEGALVAQKLGFKRIVLSRETTLADIQEIHEKTNLEIEYFVQGALCVAFSGNCYLSSLENSASGNEGKCLQLCRLPYKNNHSNESKYYLSARDLSLIENMPRLISAGVTSFKIEGRMKHSGYVGICANLYKTSLNLIKNNNFNNKFQLDANEILLKTFSRGNFNKNAYLFKNNDNNIINPQIQNHLGIKIGKIENVKPFKENLFKITIKSIHKIASGDGLKFIDKNKKQIASIGVGNAKETSKQTYEIITKYKLDNNLDVYLIQDSILENTYIKNTRKININLLISANKGENLKIKTSLQNLVFEFKSNEILAPAKNIYLTAESIKEQFSKTGDTIFSIKDINIKTNGIFAPKSLLNKIRREFFESLQENIINKNESYLDVKFLSEEYELQKTQNTITSPENLVIVDENNKNYYNSTTIIAPNNYCDFKSCNKLNIQKNSALFLPVITNFDDKKIINNIINSLPSTHPLFVNNIGGIYYKIYQAHDVIISPLLNIKNKYAIICLNEFGITKICSSIEANKQFIEENNLIYFSSGNFPLMTFAHCPYKTVYENNCQNCKFDEKLSYTSESNQEYKIKRTKIANCYFYLMKNINKEISNNFIKNLKNTKN